MLSVGRTYHFNTG